MMIARYSPGTRDRRDDGKTTSALSRIFWVNCGVLMAAPSSPGPALIQNFEPDDIGLDCHPNRKHATRTARVAVDDGVRGKFGTGEQNLVGGFESVNEPGEPLPGNAHLPWLAWEGSPG